MVLAVTFTTSVSSPTCDVCASGCTDEITLKPNTSKVYRFDCANDQVQVELYSIRVDGGTNKFIVTVVDDVEYRFDLIRERSPSYNGYLSTGGVFDETTCFNESAVFTSFKQSTAYVIIKCTNEFSSCQLRTGMNYSCVIPYDTCMLIDCGLYGTCYSGECFCDAFVSGDRCQILDVCFKVYCRYPRVCNDKGVCECEPGYTGDRCQDIDYEYLCSGISCDSHGYCYRGQCYCHTGYFGDRCQFLFGTCSDASCLHGTCVRHNSECICDPGYNYTEDGCQRIDNNCNGNSCDENPSNIIIGCSVAGGVLLLLFLSILLVVLVKNRRNKGEQQKSQQRSVMPDQATSEDPTPSAIDIT
ncbi:fibropellin-1-like [Corticium candelabrum]|uniref:fibropellin-1-like n=1 Tax=Corticium candelabrum TaxID=121492 RepID=UPI002E275988|nr:fibropellin-1-like [Corticium candelabrum]